MDSIARGLTALSPSIGQAEDFIAKKGIPEDQVPAFLAKLGDPQLAGLIAQKQRLKQEQAKQVPPGGPQKSPPTVKDEINQQLVQLMQAKQQQAQQPPMPGMPPQGAMPPQGGQPPQPGQPPMPPQGGQPPVQAAAGGLMGMGIGGLDAGAMEAPRHFDGGGVVALAAGGTGGSSVKSKEEIEKEKQAGHTPVPSDPYQAYYDMLTKQSEEYKAIGPYKQLEDPTFKEREELYKKRQADAERKHQESLRNASRAGTIAAMEAAGSGKSLFRTVTANMKETEAKRLEADKAYEDAKDALEDNMLELHKAQQAYKETGNKDDYNWKLKLQDKVSTNTADMLKAMQDQTKFKAEQDFRSESLGVQKAQAYRPTDLQNATDDFYRDYRAAQIKGDPSLKGLTDAELKAKAREKAMTLVTGMRTEPTTTNNYADAIAKIDAGASASTMRRLAATPDDPRYKAAKADYDRQVATINSIYPEQAKAVQSGQGGSGSGGTIDFNSLR